MSLMVENGLASHPGGCRNSPSHFMLQKQEMSTGLMGHWALTKDGYRMVFLQNVTLRAIPLRDTLVEADIHVNVSPTHSYLPLL